ncbi:hypothetical protein L228DRAFT_267809 [Xylona heveae TC161]|uniref:Uncharacterized protein n=1 Tax=Xylona heveae (strain CBS 132557 / TC161) TaxID=1328760 RepID=A0A165HQV2_XYLHT|nr:hypothetical protein L228DRAFT_267809 [Xylona heveae TC161]KZF23848.1 hypothetical protein L228DRAFT_267809 [Xylona heveae TC161]
MGFKSPSFYFLSATLMFILTASAGPIPSSIPSNPSYYSISSTAAECAAPTQTAQTQSQPSLAPNSHAISESQLLQIAPSSGSCSGATFADECRTAAQAVPFINQAFETYRITSAGERAAVLSIMAHESGEFKYNRNHYPVPGRPGQGTRNMQMPNYNLLYARSIPALASQVQQSSSGNDVASFTPDRLNAVLELVMPDQYSFASGSWFLTSQCTDAVRQGLQKGDQNGFGDFINECVGTTPSADLYTYWERAMEILETGD